MTNTTTDPATATADDVRRNAQAVVDLARRANSIIDHVMGEDVKSIWHERTIVDAIAGARDLVVRGRELLDRNGSDGWNLLGERTDDGFPETTPEASFGLKIEPTDEFPVDLISTCLTRAEGALSVAAHFKPEGEDGLVARNGALWAVNGTLDSIREAAALVKWIDAEASTRKAA